MINPYTDAYGNIKPPSRPVKIYDPFSGEPEEKAIPEEVGIEERPPGPGPDQESYVSQFARGAYHAGGSVIGEVGDFLSRVWAHPAAGALDEIRKGRPENVPEAVARGMLGTESGELFGFIPWLKKNEENKQLISDVFKKWGLLNKDSFWKGMAVDIITDPTNFISFGAPGAAKTIGLVAAKDAARGVVEARLLAQGIKDPAILAAETSKYHNFLDAAATHTGLWGGEKVLAANKLGAAKYKELLVSEREAAQAAKAAKPAAEAAEEAVETIGKADVAEASKAAEKAFGEAAKPLNEEAFKGMLKDNAGDTFAKANLRRATELAEDAAATAKADEKWMKHLVDIGPGEARKLLDTGGLGIQLPFMPSTRIELARWMVPLPVQKAIWALSPAPGSAMDEYIIGPLAQKLFSQVGNAARLTAGVANSVIKTSAAQAMLGPLKRAFVVETGNIPYDAMMRSAKNLHTVTGGDSQKLLDKTWEVVRGQFGDDWTRENSRILARIIEEEQGPIRDMMKDFGYEISAKGRPTLEAIIEDELGKGVTKATTEKFKTSANAIRDYFDQTSQIAKQNGLDLPNLMAGPLKQLNTLKQAIEETMADHIKKTVGADTQKMNSLQRAAHFCDLLLSGKMGTDEELAAIRQEWPDFANTLQKAKEHVLNGRRGTAVNMINRLISKPLQAEDVKGIIGKETAKELAQRIEPSLPAIDLKNVTPEVAAQRILALSKGFIPTEKAAAKLKGEVGDWVAYNTREELKTGIIDDIAKNKAEGKYIYSREPDGKTFGFTPESAPGKGDVIHVFNREAFFKAREKGKAINPAGTFDASEISAAKKEASPITENINKEAQEYASSLSLDVMKTSDMPEELSDEIFEIFMGIAEKKLRSIGELTSKSETEFNQALRDALKSGKEPSEEFWNLRAKHSRAFDDVETFQSEFEMDLEGLDLPEIKNIDSNKLAKMLSDASDSGTGSATVSAKYLKEFHGKELDDIAKQLREIASKKFDSEAMNYAMDKLGLGKSYAEKINKALQEKKIELLREIEFRRKTYESFKDTRSASEHLKELRLLEKSLPARLLAFEKKLSSKIKTEKRKNVLSQMDDSVKAQKFYSATLPGQVKPLITDVRKLENLLNAMKSNADNADAIAKELESAAISSLEAAKAKVRDIDSKEIISKTLAYLRSGTRATNLQIARERLTVEANRLRKRIDAYTAGKIPEKEMPKELVELMKQRDDLAAKIDAYGIAYFPHILDPALRAAYEEHGKALTSGAPGIKSPGEAFFEKSRKFVDADGIPLSAHEINRLMGNREVMADAAKQEYDLLVQRITPKADLEAFDDALLDARSGPAHELGDKLDSLEEAKSAYVPPLLRSLRARIVSEPTAWLGQFKENIRQTIHEGRAGKDLTGAMEGGKAAPFFTDDIFKALGAHQGALSKRVASSFLYDSLLNSGIAQKIVGSLPIGFRYVGEVLDDISRNLAKFDPETEKMYRLAGAMFKDYAVPEEVAKDLADATRRFGSQKDPGWIVKSWDKLTGEIKKFITLPYPGFHVRNILIGNPFNMLLGGYDIRNIKDIKQAWQLSLLNMADQVPTEALRRQIAKIDIAALRKTKIEGTGLTWGQAFDQFKANGLANTGFSKTELMAPAGIPGAKTLFPQTKGYAKLVDPRQLAEAGGAVMWNGEETAKIAMFVDGLRKGLSTEKAALRTRKYLFDYSDLTSFEKEYAKRYGALFYTWISRNIPLQVDALLRNPGSQGMLIKEMNYASRPDGSLDESLLPPYIKERLQIPVGVDKEGKPIMLTSLGLPIEDLYRLWSSGGLFATAKKIISENAHPFFKIPVETITGQSLFFRKPIADSPYAPEWMRTLVGTPLGNAFNLYEGKNGNLLANPTKLYLLGNIPIASRFFSTMRGLTDPASTTEAKLLNFLTGMKLTPLDFQKLSAMAARDAEREAYERGEARKLEIYQPITGKPEDVEAFKQLNKMRNSGRPQKQSSNPRHDAIIQEIDRLLKK